MPHYIIKLDTKHGPCYLDWSTIVDAPVTDGLALDDFKAYWRKEYGRVAADPLERRLISVERKGTDCSWSKSVDDVIRDNRAGPGESCWTKAQIIEHYCKPRGKRR